MGRSLYAFASLAVALLPQPARADLQLYIAAALEAGDADLVRDALGLVARARGMGEIAKKAGLNRESLYRALGETGTPEFGTVMRIVRAMGLTLSARPAAGGQTSKRRRIA